MAKLATLKNAIYRLFPGQTGKSLNVDLQTEGNSSDDGEHYHLPGFFSKPQDGLTGVVIDVKGLNIIIATHDYKLDISIDKGEALIFSYDADGNILSSAKCDKNGNFIINDGSKSAVSHTELNTALQSMVTLINSTFATKLNGSGTAGAIVLDISTSEVSEVKLP